MKDGWAYEARTKVSGGKSEMVRQFLAAVDDELAGHGLIHKLLQGEDATVETIGPVPARTLEIEGLQPGELRRLSLTIESRTF